MSNKHVYLAGPITGLTYAESTNWRRFVAAKLAPDIVPVSPMRGKFMLNDASDRKLSALYSDVGDGTYNSALLSSGGITNRDRFDTTRCDAVIANFLGATEVSIGTCVEFGWADIARVPVVMVAEPGNVHRAHSMLRSIASYIVDDLDDAVALVNMMLSDEVARTYQ